MPRRFPTPPLRGEATAVLCRLILACLHLAVVATANAAQQTLGKAQVATRPYLATMGVPALRFQEPPPVPSPAAKPIAGGPPVAASAPEVAEVSLANDQAAASTPPMPVPASAGSAASESVPPPTAEPPAKAEPTPAPKALPILPDDTRRKVQSQDFLPLFRLPGSNETLEVIVPGVATPPAPGTLPPSSATYRVE